MHGQIFCFSDFMKYSRTTRHKSLLTAAMWLFMLPLVAQINAVSPLTVFGLGDLSEGVFVQNVGIGGASIAMREPIYLNIANPASYTALQVTSLELGLSHRYIQQEIKDQDLKLTNQNTYFNYFGLGFKPSNKWGMSLSLSPYSFVGYNIFDTDSLADFGDILYEFQGSGGLNQVVFGNAFSLTENLSVGINARFIFGAWDKSNAILFNNSQFYNAKRLSSTNVNAFVFDYGLQYRLPLSNNRRLDFGATFGNKMQINATHSELSYSFLYNSFGGENVFDTVSANLNQKANIVLPSKFGVGITYGKTHPNWHSYAWMFSGEFKATQWSQFRDINSNGSLQNSWRGSVGGYFIPRFSFESSKREKTYLSKIEYRFGGFYEQTQLVINNEALTNYGVTMGLGLPIFYKNLAPGEQKLTVLNFGIVLGNRGNGQTSQINERYANFMFGITLGDKWFDKFKYR